MYIVLGVPGLDSSVFRSAFPFLLGGHFFFFFFQSLYMRLDALSQHDLSSIFNMELSSAMACSLIMDKHSGCLLYCSLFSFCLIEIKKLLYRRLCVDRG